ncbi:MAG: DNA primase, partial [Deltaproteobacteria bacterium]|nr:DNA primase [Deltaproteobacteria bacterium]
AFNSLKVNLLVSRVQGDRIESFHIDTFDLYSARHRNAFSKQAAEELGVKDGVIRRDLGKVLLALEELQEAQIRQVLEPVEQEIEISDADRDTALTFLKAPDLLDQVLVDFDRCGVVGEESNKLVGFLAAVSRKLETPLAVVIQSSSAAGKTSLLDSILSFLPSEELVQFSAMTGQSLFYMSEDSLKHKVLAVSEGEGAERAGYALKLLQSEGELTIASTGKESNTGRL